MGMLSRYQKTGGFLQLLNLIETCGPKKQEKFLTIVEEEDPRWSAALKQKMLTIEKIMAWDEEVLAEIAARLQELTLVTALHGLDEGSWAKLSTTFSHSQKRRIEERRDETNPTPNEVTTALFQIIGEVRGMCTNGYIRLDKVDESLVIEDGIEEKIISSFMEMGVVEPVSSSNESETELNFDAAMPASGGANSGEVKALRQQLGVAQNENKKLREEIRSLRGKLDQIRKIA